MNRYSLGALFRIFLPRVIPAEIKKIIYLDADTVVNLDINEFWQIDISDKPLAAVDEIRADNPAPLEMRICRDEIINKDNYFNNGVMLLNLERLRQEEETISQAIKFLTQNTQYLGFFDQNVVNYAFSENYLKLPKKFNRFVRRIRKKGITELGPNIYHFIDGPEGYGLNLNDNYNRLFLEHFAKTPFFTAETLGNIFAAFEDFYVERQNLMTRISAIMAGKKRAFYANPSLFDEIRKTFQAQDDEEMITFVPGKGYEKLAEIMKNSSGATVFFIYFRSDFLYRSCKKFLIEQGFNEWRNFINARIFCSKVHGVNLNSYQFVKKM